MSTLLLWSGGSSPPLLAADQPPAEQDATPERIDQLITQLGSSRYTVRRAAANSLRQIGAEAFDRVQQATDHADPEISASARYLLRKISIRWTSADDPPAVRRLLKNYGSRDKEQRLLILRRLAAFANGHGIASLCRIARFDRSPRLSRLAALKIIEPGGKGSAGKVVDPEVVSHEIGSSSRIAAQWLQQYLVQLRDPAAALPRWQSLVDLEANLLEQGEEQTSPEVVRDLLWNLARLHHQLGEKKPLLEVVDRMVQSEPEEIMQISMDVVEWFVEQQSWDALDLFLVKYQNQIEHAKRPLYMVALARVHQGKQTLADELAKKAAQLDATISLENVLIAGQLETKGQYDWAVREYRQLLADEPIASRESVPARYFFARMLHDHLENEEAAEVLEPLVQAIQKKNAVLQQYKKIVQYYKRLRVFELPNPQSLAAQSHYYRAWHFGQIQDTEQQREELELAVKHDPEDADVLIAMHRLPGADEAWRQDARKRIQSLSRQFQKAIDQEPGEATFYNQWAWLISNTEGDFERAVRYSHRSLELRPDTASFLDTLGRCYYSTGDYATAILYQRQAIEGQPHLQVMQRQLALFEKKLRENIEAGSLSEE